MNKKQLLDLTQHGEIIDKLANYGGSSIMFQIKKKWKFGKKKFSTQELAEILTGVRCVRCVSFAEILNITVPPGEEAVKLFRIVTNSLNLVIEKIVYLKFI